MIKYALSLIWRRKLRTILTSLGITISVVLLSTILLGMQDLERAITDLIYGEFNPQAVSVSRYTGPAPAIPQDASDSAISQDSKDTQDPAEDSQIPQDATDSRSSADPKDNQHDSKDAQDRYEGMSQDEIENDIEEDYVISSDVVSDIDSQSAVREISPRVQVPYLKLDFTESNSEVMNRIRGQGQDVSGESSQFTDFRGEKDGVINQDGIFVAPYFAISYYRDKNDKSLEDMYGDVQTISDEDRDEIFDEIIGETVTVNIDSRSLDMDRTYKIPQESLDISYEYTVKGVFTPGMTPPASLEDGPKAPPQIILPEDHAFAILASQNNFESSQSYIQEMGYDSLYIQAQEGQANTVQSYVRENYPFPVGIADDLVSFTDQFLSAFRVGFLAFGSVSGVVAAIGIMNTMIMSVYEQTKEIGIIKSMGASRLQVLIVFLIQSGATGLFGALVGLSIVLTGMYFADPFIVDFLNEDGGFDLDTFFHFDLGLISAIIGASIVVGMIAGIYPALRAAYLNPVTALRSD